MRSVSTAGTLLKLSLAARLWLPAVVATFVTSGCKSVDTSGPTADAAPAAASGENAPPPQREPPHPRTQVAIAQKEANGARIDGQYVYWQTADLEKDEGSISRAVLSGGSTQELVEHQKGLVSFATAGSVLFWLVDDDGRSEVRSTTLGSTGPVKKLAVRKPGATGLYAFNGFAYWSEFGSLFRIPAGGGPITSLHQRVENAGGAVNALIGDHDEIFWSIDDTLVTQHADGSGFRELTNGFRQVRGLAFDSRYIYVADAGDGKVGYVFRVDRASASKVTIVERAARPWSLAAIADQVYVVSNDDRGSLTRIQSDGGAPVAFAPLRAGSSVAANDAFVVWTNAGPGEVVRTPR